MDDAERSLISSNYSSSIKWYNPTTSLVIRIWCQYFCVSVLFFIQQKWNLFTLSSSTSKGLIEQDCMLRLTSWYGHHMLHSWFWLPRKNSSRVLFYKTIFFFTNLPKPGGYDWNGCKSILPPRWWPWCVEQNDFTAVPFFLLMIMDPKHTHLSWVSS